MVRFSQHTGKKKQLTAGTDILQLNQRCCNPCKEGGVWQSMSHHGTRKAERSRRIPVPISFSSIWSHLSPQSTCGATNIQEWNSFSARCLCKHPYRLTWKCVVLTACVLLNPSKLAINITHVSSTFQVFLIYPHSIVRRVSKDRLTKR